MRVVDISQPLKMGMPVWPGDRPFGTFWSARIEKGSSVNVGAACLSLHTGTHADAPLHVSDRGDSIDRLPLGAFVGPAVVVEAIGTGPISAVTVDSVDVSAAPRILIKTRTTPPPEVWDEAFAHLSLDLVAALAARGAVLVGVDTPSVDPPSSKSLDAHHALYRAGIANIENLRLDHVKAGRYVLVAVPLMLEGMDASPVRAVLLPQD